MTCKAAAVPSHCLMLSHLPPDTESRVPARGDALDDAPLKAGSKFGN